MRDQIKHIYPSINDDEFDVQDDGAGPVIKRWSYAQPQPTQAEIDSAFIPAAKAQRIDAINAECRARLIARYGPAEEQVSRSIGIYGATEQAAMTAGIAATIDASNEASNAVLAAADIAAVEAVTVAWPVI